MKQKILLDTDIGSDIDDALCLAYLLANPKCELFGITTVSGQAKKRAMLASVLCKVAGQNIPIYPGLEKPLVISQKQKYAPQAIKLANWPHQKYFPKNKAIDFMRQTIHANPKQLTILCIGPLTNIAMLFKLDPEIPSLLKSIFLMSGVFTNKVAGPNSYDAVEWNTLVDPHAAAIVYGSNVKIHRSVGLDVTTQLTMNTEQAKKRLLHPLLAPVLDFAGVWFEETDEITFHDPLAATVIFNKNICVFSQGKVEIELTSERLRGMTYFLSKKGDREIALKVNKQKFFEEYFSVFH